MALYARLLGHDDDMQGVAGGIGIHAFQAIMAEFGRGRITGPQAQQAVADVSGTPLTPSEVTEAQTLLATITAATGQAGKLARVKEIDDVLLVGQGGGLYITPTLVASRLGV